MMGMMNQGCIRGIGQQGRWALFLSGRGSTAQAVMDLGDRLDLRLVVSNRPGVPGLARARRMGIPTWLMSSPLNWGELSEELKSRCIRNIFLLGFMRILPSEFIDPWAGRILNVHPSLLPLYPGVEAMERSFQDRASMGVSVHNVVADVDAGSLLHQKKILEAFEDWGTTHRRMVAMEQRLVREGALRWRKWDEKPENRREEGGMGE